MRFISNSVKETIDLGKLIAKEAREGDIICLYGELGSGKTVLAKGIAKGLGVNYSKVASPTFVLIREHKKARLPLYHFDLYRLKNAEEILKLGYEEYFFGTGVSVIEWADRLKNLAPQQCLCIHLKVENELKRSFVISAKGARYVELLKGIHENIRH